MGEKQSVMSLHCRPPNERRDFKLTTEIQNRAGHKDYTASLKTGCVCSISRRVQITV